MPLPPSTPGTGAEPGFARRPPAGVPSHVALDRQRRWWAVLAIALVGVAAYEGELRYQSVDAHLSVLAVIAVAVIALIVSCRGAHRETSVQWLAHAVTGVAGFLRHPSRYGAGVAVWIVLFAALFSFDLTSLLLQRADLPTLSRLVGKVTHDPVGRAAFVLGWLALGVAVLRLDRNDAAFGAVAGGPHRPKLDRPGVDQHGVDQRGVDGHGLGQ